MSKEVKVITTVDDAKTKLGEFITNAAAKPADTHKFGLTVLDQTTADDLVILAMTHRKGRSTFQAIKEQGAAIIRGDSEYLLPASSVRWWVGGAAAAAALVTHALDASQFDNHLMNGTAPGLLPFMSNKIEDASDKVKAAYKHVQETDNGMLASSADGVVIDGVMQK